MRKCKICKEEKPIEEFIRAKCIKNGKEYFYHLGSCRTCYNSFLRERYKKSDKTNHHKNLYEKRKKDKRLVYEHYGNKCVCCGESEVLFLVIDHIENDGYKYRKKNGKNIHSNIYSWLVSNDFPKGFQVLCSNCNIGKHRNKGVCPHNCQEPSETIPSGSTPQAIGGGKATNPYIVGVKI